MPAVRNLHLKSTPERRIPIRSDEGEWEYSAPVFASKDAGRRPHTTSSPRPTSVDTSSTRETAQTQTSSTTTTRVDQIYDDSLMICTCPSSSRDRAPISKGTSEKKRVRLRRVKNQDHIPRPRNAFIIFRSHYINFLKAKVNGDGSPDPTVDEERTYPAEEEDLFIQPQRVTKKPQSSTSAEYQQNELSKIAAKVWNKMDADERRPYSEEARKEKEWHKKMYPDYVYRAPSASGEKTKRFKIKVKMGNPSKDQDRTRDSTSLSSETNVRAPQSPGRQEPDYSDASSVPSLAAPLVLSDIDIEVVGVPRQWHQENPSQHYDQQYLLQSIGAEQDFVPTECIPPLELCSSRPIERECQDEADTTLKACPPQQPTYAVDLSPRSLAYDQYQAQDALSTSYPQAFVAPLTEMLRYEYGITEFEAPLAGFGPDEALPPASSFLDNPTSTSFEVDEVPYLSFIAAPDSFSLSTSLPYTQNSNFDCDFSAFQLESIMDKFIPLDLEVDVPDLNFQVGDGVMRDRDDLSLAAWAGYGL